MNLKKKAQVLLLPTDKADGCLLKGIGTLQRFPDKYFTQEYLIETKRTSHHLYIVDDSEIKIEDYGIGFAEGIKGVGRGHYLFYHDGSSKAKLNVMAEGSKKVIATTDKLLNLPSSSDEFIQKYIESYNKGNVILDVMLDYIDNGEEGWSGSDRDGEPVWNEKIELKVDSKNLVTITRCKDSWNREEITELFEKFVDQKYPLLYPFLKENL